jgi:hypothetical protein
MRFFFLLSKARKKVLFLLAKKFVERFSKRISDKREKGCYI